MSFFSHIAGYLKDVIGYRSKSSKKSKSIAVSGPPIGAMQDPADNSFVLDPVNNSYITDPNVGGQTT